MTSRRGGVSRSDALDIGGVGRKRRKGRSRILPNVDLLNLAASEQKYGSYSIPRGPKVEARYAAEVGSLGVAATFPTAEQIRGRGRRGKDLLDI